VFSERLDICSLFPLWTLLHLKAHILFSLQRFEAAALNLRKMREQVFTAAVRRDEPKALRIVEPLRYSCCRYLSKPRLSL
jgi:hypothetical protein